MAKKKPANPESVVRVPFPLNGLDQTRAFSVQREGTTPQAYNVRTFDPITDRARMASRSGMVKFNPNQVYSSNPIQLIDHFDTVASAPPWVFNNFVYAIAAGGFGIGNDFTGASVATATGTAQPLQCSCWDTLGNVYAGLGSAAGTSAYIVAVGPTGTLLWTSNAITVYTGPGRQIVGMTICGNFLYVMYMTANGQGSNNAKIAQIDPTTGTIINTAWLASGSVSSGLANFNVSSAFSNCLAAIGTTLGLISYGSSTAVNFYTFNGAINPAGSAITNVVLSVTALTNGSSTVRARWFRTEHPTGTSMRR